MNFEKLDRKLVNGFKDGFIIFLMIRKKRNNKKRRVNVMIVEYILGLNLGMYLIVFVILKSMEVVGFFISLVLVKLCFFLLG